MLTRVVSVRGVPVSAPPASSSHVTIAKTVTAADGGAVDLGRLVQNERLVVHLAGDVDDDAYHQAMLVDPLPAGFEIERVVPVATAAEGNGLPWLGEDHADADGREAGRSFHGGRRFRPRAGAHV